MITKVRARLKREELFTVLAGTRGEWGTPEEIMEDTGSSEQLVKSVLKSLRDKGLGHSRYQERDSGRVLTPVWFDGPHPFS